MKKIDIDFKNLANIKQRFCIKDIENFLNCHLEHPDDTIAIVDGLFGTGKTTILQQIIKIYKSKQGFENKIDFYDVELDDTMEDIYKILEKQESKIVCFNNITNAKDFIDDSAILANIYAKYRIGIVISGDYSLEFTIAKNHKLYARTETFSTNYVPYIEAKQVFNFSIDDYIKYGGLINKDLLKDYNSFTQYIDNYIVYNIIISAKKTKEEAIEEDVINNIDDIKTIIYKMLDTYCGAINKNLLLRDLKKVNYDIDKLSISNYIKFVHKNKNTKNKNRQFLKKLDADYSIKIDYHSIYWLVRDLHIFFSDMGLLGKMEVDSFYFKEKDKWYDGSIRYNKWLCGYKKQYHLIQPFIKYFFLSKKLDYIDDDKFKKNFNFELTDDFKLKLKNKLIENIENYILRDSITLDVFKILKDFKYDYYLEGYGNRKSNRYGIKKMEFTKDNSSLDILDLWVGDYENKIYYLFKIVNSTKAQIEFLKDKNLMEYFNYYFSQRYNIIILYKGENLLDKENNILYLGIEYFLTCIHKYKDLKFIIELFDGIKDY